MKSPRIFLSILSALILVFALGCAEEPEVETTPVTNTGTAANQTTTEEVPRLPDGSEPVQVVLTEMNVDMPSTLPEGRTLFTVSNEGDEEHSFEVEGQGIEKELDKHLQPGEVTTIDIDLVPGEYRVYCPVGDHADQGMEMTLTVTRSEGTGATTGTGDQRTPPASDTAI